MPNKKLAEFREMGIKEAEAKVVEFKAELARQRALAIAGTKTESPGKIKKYRKMIAKVLTIINEKKLGANAEGKKAKTQKTETKGVDKKK